MKVEEARYYLRNLAVRFRMLKFFEIGLSAIGLSLLVFAVARFIYPEVYFVLLVSVLAMVTILVWKVYQTKVLRWNDLQIAFYLNRLYPELMESADLAIVDKPLTGLQGVQQFQVLDALSKVRMRIQIPHRIGQSMLVLLVGIIVFLSLPEGIRNGPTKVEPSEIKAAQGAVQPIPEIQHVMVEITPPIYTLIKRHQVQNPNIGAPINSKAKWHVSFAGTVVDPQLIFSASDTVLLYKGKDNAFQVERKLTENTFYQIAWRDHRKQFFQSEFYRVEAREDLAPKVEIHDLNQFSELRSNASPLVGVQATLSDDYGIADAYMIATVSKGSGESVKFREEKLLFEQPERILGKQITVSREIDLQKLGLEPGDELYFYAVVVDNMAPKPNTARTETYFIALQDTAVQAAVADTGLGVDLMPDYFRSQRQIIIDTEKLLKEQRRIKRVEFNTRSNELGFDQKALRLKYGQFLGEEEDSGIAVEAVEVEEEPGEEGEAENPLTKFGHQHDTENEHNQVAEKRASRAAPEHAHIDTGEKEEEEDPMKAIMHHHDNQEEATFFIESVKTKLKAALTLMWDAELHLRLYEPKKSLPFQYRILTLLKEISQDSRVYVHRTGFDPPPIKEEKRLTGDQEEIINSAGQFQAVEANKYPAIVAALTAVEEMLQQPTPQLTDSTRILFNQAGYEVASSALEHPGRYLQTLSTLQKLSVGELEPIAIRKALLSIRVDFWSILPLESYSPSRPTRTMHHLDKAMLRNLENGSHE